MTHTLEPWHVSQTYPLEVTDEGGRLIADCDSAFQTALGEELANARRIVACVNACAGIEDPAQMRRQRDELAKALEVVIAAWDNADWLDGNQFEEFRAIVAQAKGGQD